MEDSCTKFFEYIVSFSGCFEGPTIESSMSNKALLLVSEFVQFLQDFNSTDSTDEDTSRTSLPVALKKTTVVQLGPWAENLHKRDVKGIIWIIGE